MTKNKTILISIHPKYASLIFSKEKTVELRKNLPILSYGDKVLVYVTSPEKYLIGEFIVKSFIESSPQKIWPMVKDISGLSRKEFLEYYKNKRKAQAIFIKNTKKYKAPMPLEKIKSLSSNFYPPQSFTYARELLPNLTK